MKKLGNRKRTAEAKTHFTIDLDIKGMLFFSIMVVLTGVTVFYLGVIFGKASRQPGQQLNQPDMEERVNTQEEDLTIPKDLEIFDINDNPQNMDKLTKNVRKALKKTEAVIKETQKLETPVVSPKQSETPQEQKRWPERNTIVNKPVNIYTVQVFVTKSKEKANNLTRQLRQKKFNAYVQEVQHENQKLYKIRVGRKPKEEISALKQQLQKVVGGMGMGLSVIKVN